MTIIFLDGSQKICGKSHARRYARRAGFAVDPQNQSIIRQLPKRSPTLEIPPLTVAQFMALCISEHHRFSISNEVAGSQLHFEPPKTAGRVITW